ncbi:hypothetical protein [Stieleria varia]|uniref:hypothetical protein n=1 Tax=Stieleria varia TaxID=2528005 RepID=UPI0011B5DBA8|nr:hypothetical protein [Stieleria varia]
MSTAQQIEDTNGDGIIDESEEPQMPKLIASTPKAERQNELVPGIYVNVSEIRGFHTSYLHVRKRDYKFFLFACTGGFTDDGEIELTDGWFSAGGDYWHPDKVNGRDILWRGDAWRVWTTDHKLYDYGVLVRVEGNDPIEVLKNPPSVSDLYDADTKTKVGEWRDPFIFGARDLNREKKAEPSDAPQSRSRAF